MSLELIHPWMIKAKHFSSITVYNFLQLYHPQNRICVA